MSNSLFSRPAAKRPSGGAAGAKRVCPSQSPSSDSAQSQTTPFGGSAFRITSASTASTGLAEHLQQTLHANAAEVGTLVQQLTSVNARALSSHEERLAREEEKAAARKAQPQQFQQQQQQQPNPFFAAAAALQSPFASSLAVSSLDAAEAQPESKQQSSNQSTPSKPLPPLQCEFEPAPVRMIDFSSTPPSEVQSISAFGLTWKPVGRRKQPTTAVTAAASSATPASAAAASSSSSSAPAVSASALLSFPPQCTAAADEPSDFVSFFSVQSASFACPPSAELAAHQQRLKQLPAAIESNAKAMEVAEATGEVAEIGVLYLERKRLQQELQRMQTQIPAGCDVVEVRDTLELPYGFVTLDNRIYLLQRLHEGICQNRAVRAVQLHEGGRFKPAPYDSAAIVSPPQQLQLPMGLDASDILTEKHTAGLLRLFDGKQPAMRLLYSGKRDGMTAADFHRLCDNEGATLTVIRTAPPIGAACIIGGWAEQSWNSAEGHTVSSHWLFSFRAAALATSLSTSTAAAVTVAKYHSPSELKIYRNRGLGPSFGGNEGCGLRIGFTHDNMANLTGYELVKGYEPAWLPFGGADQFHIDSIETWSCRL